jgi:signal transduction histidine kinase
MLAALALSGWVAAAAGLSLAIAGRRRLAERMELVARASHELRGPITAATLGLRLSDLTAPSRRALELELGRAGLALEELAAVERRAKLGRAVDAVDVRQLLIDSVEAWRPAAAERCVELALRWSGGPLVVLGDRLRLAQATGNLIANAIEHGGGRVEVRGCADIAGVRVEVLDRGPGLPSPVAVLARRPRRGRGARGRGLAIASAVVSDHGGRLAAAPSERGARLVLTLPAARAPDTHCATNST